MSAILFFHRHILILDHARRIHAFAVGPVAPADSAIASRVPVPPRAPSAAPPEAGRSPRGRVRGVSSHLRSGGECIAHSGRHALPSGGAERGRVVGQQEEGDERGRGLCGVPRDDGGDSGTDPLRVLWVRVHEREHGDDRVAVVWRGGERIERD